MIPKYKNAKSKVKYEKNRTLGRSRRALYTIHFSRTAFCLLFTANCLLFFSGCDESFQPLENNEVAPFSMYGYLDASADTQWVRVTPVREQLELPPVKPEMHVTIEHLESGDTVVMKDSLFLFPDGFHILNAWSATDMLNPEQTYRLRAERPDGATSSITLTIPEDFPTPTLQEIGGGCSANLRIDGVERLADVQSKWHIRFFFSGQGEDRFYSIPYRSQAFEVDEESYSVFISTSRELSEIFEQMVSTPDSSQILSRQIFVASGGPEWIEDIASLDDLVYALPEGLSNVEDGVGYMVGIVSKTIPFESCFE